VTQPDPSSDRPPRRPRYRGRNPRLFHEKYKEHDPERYADDVAKVLDSGKTPAGMHRPIMVREILEILAPQPGETAVDCTLGYGGHARELLAAVQPGGRLLGVDADPIELPKAEARLRCLGYPDESLIVRRMNYAGVAQFLATEAPDGADVLLADLGLSSMQLDDPARGFTYKADGPLDMRMNPGRGLSAADLLSRYDVGALAALLRENADEPLADELAAAIHAAHARSPLTPTRRHRSRRHRPTSVSGAADRRERRVRSAGHLLAATAVLPETGRPGGDSDVSFQRRPPCEAGVQGGPAHRDLQPHRRRCCASLSGRATGQPAFVVGQTAVRGAQSRRS
jgi:hypothetical protein